MTTQRDSADKPATKVQESIRLREEMRKKGEYRRQIARDDALRIKSEQEGLLSPAVYRDGDTPKQERNQLEEPRCQTTNKQRKIVKTGLTIMVLMMMFPPFYFKFDEGETESAGIGCVIAPPEYRYYVRNRIKCATIDVPQLLVQWLCVGVVTAGFVFINRPRRAP